MTLVRFQPATYKNPFSDFWNLPAGNAAQALPMVNILETKDGFRLELAAPGLSKEDFTIQVEKNLLTVSAKKEKEEATDGVKIHRREFSYHTFERSFRLPDSIDTDKVDATFNQGVLQINLVLKAEMQPQTKTIAIS